MLFLILFAAIALFLKWRRAKIGQPSRPVFLIDFTCYKPPESQSRTMAEVMRQMRTHSPSSSPEILDFMEKTMERSGLGDSTYFPDSFFRESPTSCLDAALEETGGVMFGAVDELIRKTGVEGRDIGILIVNCTIFAPVPSLEDMIVNKFKLRDEVRTYNLQGMGCSASLSAVDLAKNLLKVHKDSSALIVSTENITHNIYLGEDRSMNLVNCIFRVGGAAILLSNRPSDRPSAKYELIHTVHTITASSDTSYNCIVKKDDNAGKVGVAITKDLLVVANETIKANVTALGRLILPTSEKLIYAINCLRWQWQRQLQLANDTKPYVPNFTQTIEHVFPHVGGKPVLDGLQRSLRLSDKCMEAPRMTLYRFGNTSSSSIWYEMAYTEAKGRMKKGDRVWQIAFGSGFKCSSVIWKAMRSIGHEEANPWADEIEKFPVDLVKTKSIPYYLETPTTAKLTGET